MWSFSAMGNGHCVADLEALILFTVRQAITYRYQFWLIDINCSVNKELSSVINFLAQRKSRFFHDPSCLPMRHDCSVICVVGIAKWVLLSNLRLKGVFDLPYCPSRILNSILGNKWYILIQNSFAFIQLSVKTNSRRPILKPKSVVSSGIFTPDK